jgi:hypothetical protein
MIPRYLLERRLNIPQSRYGRNGEVKILYPTGTRTRSLAYQPVTSRYTNYATTAHWLPFNKYTNKYKSKFNSVEENSPQEVNSRCAVQDGSRLFITPEGLLSCARNFPVSLCKVSKWAHILMSGVLNTKQIMALKALPLSAVRDTYLTYSRQNNLSTCHALHVTDLSYISLDANTKF